MEMVNLMISCQILLWKLHQNCMTLHYQSSPKNRIFLVIIIIIYCQFNLRFSMPVGMLTQLLHAEHGLDGSSSQLWKGSVQNFTSGACIICPCTAGRYHQKPYVRTQSIRWKKTHDDYLILTTARHNTCSWCNNLLLIQFPIWRKRFIAYVGTHSVSMLHPAAHKQN